MTPAIDPAAAPMAREMTVPECREKFLRHLSGIVDYWLNESRRPDAKGKLEGMAFSFLVLLDGGSGFMPGFELRPVSPDEDKEYCRTEGENWWPSETDIGGALHEEWHAVRRAAAS